MNIERIDKLAHQMEAALRALPEEVVPAVWKDYPRGCCGDASLLMGALLEDQGFEGFRYVCGERGSLDDNSWSSHGWLRKNDLIIDLTAGQFSDAPSEVVVARLSRWHQTFEIESEEPADFRVWSGPGTVHLHRVYDYLKPQLLNPKRKSF